MGGALAATLFFTSTPAAECAILERGEQRMSFSESKAVVNQFRLLGRLFLLP